MSISKKLVISSFLATAIVLPISANISNADVKSIEYRMVTGNSVNFRTGPGTNYSSVGKLNKGYKVEYIGISGSWVNVKYNGKIGYIHKDYISSSSGISDNNVKSTKIVTASSLNFRSGASTSASKIGSLLKGTEVGFISESNGWSKISYKGKVGYVSSRYLSNKLNTPSTDNNVKSTKIVTASSLNFRRGASTNASKIGTIPKGTEVGFISESNGWSKISYNGKVGYVSSRYLSNKLNTPSTDNNVKSTKIVTASSLNFRRGASTNASKIGTIPKGTEVGFISESNGWSKISYNGKVGYVSSSYLADKSSSNVSSYNKADKVIEFAKTLLGKPYVWGAEGPSSFDCSGYTQYVFKKSVGISLPRVSREQAKFGKYVSRNNLQKGDLIALDMEGANNGQVNHIGIYMGDGKIIHASATKKKVLISNMTDYYYKSIVSIRRVL